MHGGAVGGGGGGGGGDGPKDPWEVRTSGALYQCYKLRQYEMRES